MKKINKYRYIRILVAILFCVPITLIFIDFTKILPDEIHSLVHLQWIPVLLLGNMLIAVPLLLAILFGRFYCSALCPLGVLQDLMIRTNRLFRKKPKYKYHKPHNAIRYSILFLTLVSTFFGSTALLLWLDPYSNFGRIASNLLRPAVIGANNLIAAGLNANGNYSLYDVPITTVTWISLSAASFILVILLFTTWRHGRLYCNTICPVGTGLGLLSRFSLYKVRIDPAGCSGCGRCASKCKAECIDTKAKEIDLSRCVSCYNCLKSCKQEAIQLVGVSRILKPDTINRPVLANESRRKMLQITGMALAGAATAKAANLKNGVSGDSILHRRAIMPPGAGDRKHFDSHCTGCQLCIARCPSHVLKPAGIQQYGLGGMLQPYMDYKSGFCNYNCTVCTKVCPTSALTPCTIEEKRQIQVGVVQFRRHLCVVVTDGTSCGACSEHCPTQAVAMVAYQDGLTIPEINTSLCIGCGGCEYICPVLPYKAIYVEGKLVQEEAMLPTKEQVKEEKIEDFGF